MPSSGLTWSPAQSTHHEPLPLPPPPARGGRHSPKEALQAAQRPISRTKCVRTRPDRTPAVRQHARERCVEARGVCHRLHDPLRAEKRGPAAVSSATWDAGGCRSAPCSLRPCTRLKCPSGLDLQLSTLTDTREPRSRGMRQQGTRTWESVHGKPLGTRVFKHTHWGLSPRPCPAHHQESHPGPTVGSRLCDLF